jgi:methylase of polypeptide subunit release factors
MYKENAARCSVLDVACGSGVIALAVARMNSVSKVDACDLSPRMLVSHVLESSR